MGSRPGLRSRSALLSESRARRRTRWEEAFPPWALACAGAAISVAFLFQRDLPIKALMFLCFLGAALVSGKKISLIATILVSAGIVAANLLVPVGKVIAVLGPMKITQTALLDGLGKALAFEGLIHISKASILPGVRLPGRFGELVAQAFVYYDRIVEYKGRIKAASLIEDVDALMLELWDSPSGAPAKPGPRKKVRPAALAALGAAVAISFALLLVKI